MQYHEVDQTGRLPLAVHVLACAAQRGARLLSDRQRTLTIDKEALHAEDCPGSSRARLCRTTWDTAVV